MKLLRSVIESLPLLQVLLGSRALKNKAAEPSEPELIASGWDKYAKSWKPEKFQPVPGQRVQYLGDEWTVEDVGAGTYGLPADVLSNFDNYLSEQLINRYLPARCGAGLEIGPGGGRATALLAPRTDVLHLADASEGMLEHLKQRFAGQKHLHYYKTDGMTLPPLQPGTLDYVFAFDVFVHFEPRLVYWYLRQAANLLKKGGTGMIHYANTLTSTGWHLFQSELATNVKHRANFGAFGVMCPELMTKFLETLNLEIISSDLKLIPRDAVAVFRKA